MLKRVEALWRRLSGRASGTALPVAGAQVDIRKFGPARFQLRNQLGPDRSPLELTLQLSSMRVERGLSTMEIRIRDHGLTIDSVVEGNEGKMLVYLGNYFIVPAELRRVGLAAACVAAIRQAFQIAAFGRILPDQITVLEGYFVGPGHGWALAMCDGKLPTKARPATVNLHRLQAAEETMELLMPPTRLE